MIPHGKAGRRSLTQQEIIRHINNGADHYVRLFGQAEHMEIVDRTFYSLVRPKGSVHGISMVFQVRLEGLPSAKQQELIAEIKALHVPVWFDLTASDELHRLFFSCEKRHGQTVLDDDDEVYLALLPEQAPCAAASAYSIVNVQTAEEFALWARMCNDLFANGAPDVHPLYHYPLCQHNLMKCYIAYVHDQPAAIGAIMNNHGIASLEFVATVPEWRRRGLARALCDKAIHDTFADGAKIITVRAINAGASRLYQSVGFTAYNYAL